MPLRFTTFIPHAGRPANAALAFLLMTIPGCGRGGEEESGDVPVVEVTEVTVLGDDGGELFGVRDLWPADGGSVWVLNEYEPYLLLLSGGGDVRRSLGRQGGGPGEFGNPWHLVEPRAGAEVEVWDIGRRRMVGVGADGEAPAAVPLSFDSGIVRGDIGRISYGTAGHAARLGNGYVVGAHPEGVRQTRDLARAVLLALDSTGAVRDTLRDGRSPDAARDEMLGSADSFVPIPLWTTCGARDLVLFDPYARTLERRAADGTHVSTDTLDAVPARPISDGEIRNHLRHVLELEARDANVAPPEDLDALVERILESGRAMFGRVAPEAVSVLCGPGGDVWLQRFDATEHPLGYGREWRVVRGGRTRAVVRFPAGFQPAHVGEDGVLGVFTDEMDVERPARAPLPLLPS